MSIAQDGEWITKVGHIEIEYWVPAVGTCDCCRREEIEVRISDGDNVVLQFCGPCAEKVGQSVTNMAQEIQRGS